MNDFKLTILLGLVLVALVFGSQWLIEPLGADFGQLPTATFTPVVRETATATATPSYLAACPTTPGGSGFGYLPDAPMTTTLVAANSPGEHITIGGGVYAGDCETPLSDVLIEVWHNDKQQHR